MDNQEKATPRPWQVVTLDGDVYLQMGDGSKKNSGGGLLAKISEPLGADKNTNASLIVKAVNNHDDALEAIRQGIAYLEAIKNGKTVDIQYIQGKMREVLFNVSSEEYRPITWEV